jgi:hypothetical protein
LLARLEIDITDLCLDAVDDTGCKRGCIYATLVRWSSLGIAEAIGSVGEGTIGEFKELGNVGDARRSVLDIR